jgi:hypothetical protein
MNLKSSVLNYIWGNCKCVEYAGLCEKEDPMANIYSTEELCIKIDFIVDAVISWSGSDLKTCHSWCWELNLRG